MKDDMCKMANIIFLYWGVVSTVANRSQKSPIGLLLETFATEETWSRHVAIRTSFQLFRHILCDFRGY